MAATEAKEPFDIDRAIDAIRAAVAPFPPAALFQLADEGFGSVLEVLVGCLISIRTHDEDTLIISRRLFARARRAEELAALSVEELVALIRGSQFPEPKAAQIKEIARQAAAQANGDLPCDEAFLLALHGVGPKCANLALGIACGPEQASHVPVDVHVHRIANRWGYVSAKTPEKTMVALDAVLPTRYRLAINRLLVPFGKHICTGTCPHCSTCPVSSMCQQVDVSDPR